MSKSNRRRDERQAREVVDEFLERDMVPEECLRDVDDYLDNDEFLRALRAIQDARHTGTT